MTSTITDRIYGESSGVAVKAPCATVATLPLPLSGLAAIGGYVPQPGDRILVIAQADPTTNGIYNAAAGAWARTGDFNGPYDCVQGTLVVVYFPSVSQAFFYQLTTANPVIGTTPLNFAAFINPTSLAYGPTLAENTVGAVIVNIFLPPGNVLRYGSNAIPGTTDMTAAIQTCINVCGLSGDVCYFPAGTYLISTDISVPIGTKFLQGGAGPFAINLQGEGREQTIIQFSVTGAFVNGFYWNGGGAAKLAGSCKDIQFYGAFATNTGVTVAWGDMPQFERCLVRNFNGRGMYFHNTIMPILKNVYTGGVGSAAQAAIEFDQCTTVQIEDTYVSGGNAGCIAGIAVDRSAQVYIRGGASESAGTPILISGLIPINVGCTGVTIQEIDLENPGNGNRYIDAGAALTGGGFVQNLKVDTLTMFPSGTTTQPSAIRLQNVLGAEISNSGLNPPAPVSGVCTISIANPAVITFANAFVAGQQVFFSTTGALPTGIVAGTEYFVSATGLSGASFQISAVPGGASIATSGAQSGVQSITTTIATIELAGANNLGINVRKARANFGQTWPWVTFNGVQVKAASPYYDWTSEDSPKGLAGGFLVGATPSILISAQGGYYASPALANGGATNITLTGLEQGMQFVIIGDGFSTFTQGTTNGTFNLLGGANLLAAAGKSYAFLVNSVGCAVQH